MYIAPSDDPVTDTWQGHKDRNSKEPGTDYGTPYGTDCKIPGDGMVALVDNSNNGAEGRRLEIYMDNGQVIDMIHADVIHATAGMRVEKGQQGIFISGASGNGDDWYYGPHVHVTLRAMQGLPFSETIDFELFIGEEIPDRLVDDVPVFFEPNTIVWPNGWANAYDRQIYDAIKGYTENPNSPDWQWVSDTYTRESWAAVDGLQARQVAAANSTSTYVTVREGIAVVVGGIIAFIAIIAASRK